MDNIKILHLLNTFLPNTENWIYNLLTNTKNCEHHIGAYKFISNQFKTNQFNYAEKAVDQRYSLRNESKSKGIKRIFEKLQLKIHDYTKGTTKSELITYCKSNQIQLLHAHFANIGWEMLDIKKKTNLPFIISFYGWDYEMLPHVNPKFKQYYQILFQEADGFICEGQHGAILLERMGCPKNKIHIVHLGVQVKKIPFHKREKSKGSLKLVQLASFTEKKGHIYSIKAFQKAIAKGQNMELTLIGNERKKGLLHQLKQLVSSLGIEDKIHFLPAIDYNNLYNTLQDFDVFIHPSCYTDERDCEGGAPIVLLDAQATGMPIISTVHCDIPGEVIHQTTGLLSPEKNILKISKAIDYFYKMDQDEYSTFRSNARRHVENDFDIEKNALHLESIYKNLVQNNGNND